jgi:predicted DCC family thiol-disulfide oxidoreductase YuxK
VNERPLLIYDGQCPFCIYCVDYARLATGPAVDYRPYQDVQQDFPQISEDEFQSSIRLVQPDGRLSSGARAAFEVLALGGYTRLWNILYTTLPLFGAISEWCYRFVARHRAVCYRISRLLFGPSLQPASIALTSWLFLRLLALVYLAAFTSFTMQAPGLIGPEGILPAERYFAAVGAGLGPEKYWMLPSLLWLDASTTAIQLLGWTGSVISVLLLLNLLPRLCLPCLYLLYLSLFYGGQVFMSFQWDILLLECGFLAIFLPWAPRLFTWMYRWLLFRFMLQSGLVKLMSGDTSWRNLTALDFHFETQPLPSMLAWYADKLPSLVLQAGVVFTFVVELLVPFLILMPRRPRCVAAVSIALFQLTIIATGSYNYFNLLTLCLCLLLLDDQMIMRLCPASWPAHASRQLPGRSGALRSTLLAVVALVYLVQSAVILNMTGNRTALSETARRVLTWSAPFHIANGYGLFAVMTTNRPEIIIEGSRDGREWLAYELPYKPGALDRAPRWATPHQPRLDWQLWFAALAPREHNPWLGGLMSGLLLGSEPILTLFQHNPFAEAPPQYIRASLYQYRFSERPTRQQTGDWWSREYQSRFWPVTGWRLQVEPVADEMRRELDASVRSSLQ